MSKLSLLFYNVSDVEQVMSSDIRRKIIVCNIKRI